MRRVAVTGLGIVSCLGNELSDVDRALRESRSGIRLVDAYRDAGLRSWICGLPDLTHEPPIERRHRRFMADPAIYAFHALRKAIDDAQLAGGCVSHPATGLVVGSGTGSVLRLIEAVDKLRESGVARVPPYAVPQVMASTASASLATAFGIRGISYSLSAACATSAHCIGHAFDLVRFGKQDIVFAGGAEEACWTSAAMFDAMGALSVAFNDAPQAASRPYDEKRDGFVMAGGSGILVLEELAHAKARGARIYAEIVGYGASSDGCDMILPDKDGVMRAMQLALRDAGFPRVDYLNTHATSTPAGDLVELAAVREVFGASMPPISSTKGLTGHAIGAAGAHEAIYSLLMLKGGYIAACANLDTPSPQAQDYPLVTAYRTAELGCVMSNSLGFGGSNASLVFRTAI